MLLKNDGLLPLKRKKLDSIAVIGPGADEYLTGGGSSEIKPFSFTSPLEGITAVAGKGVKVTGDDGTDVGAGDAARGRLRRRGRRPRLVLDRGRRPDLSDASSARRSTATRTR